MQPLLQKAGVQADTADLTTQEMPQNSGPKNSQDAGCGLYQLYRYSLALCGCNRPMSVDFEKQMDLPPGSLNTGESKRFAFRSCQRSVKEILADVQKHLKETNDGSGEVRVPLPCPIGSPPPLQAPPACTTFSQKSPLVAELAKASTLLAPTA